MPVTGMVAFAAHMMLVPLRRKNCSGFPNAVCRFWFRIIVEPQRDHLVVEGGFPAADEEKSS